MASIKQPQCRRPDKSHSVNFCRYCRMCRVEKADMARIRTDFRSTTSSAGFLVMNLLTFPYYRFFRQNTLFPILAIAKKVDSQESNAKLAAMLLSWWNRKLYELYFIQVAGTLLSGAVIGCFSWPSRNTEHWIGSAARYCSLVLSLFAILLSSSQSFILNAIIQKNSRAGLTTQINSLARDLNMVCHIVWRDRKLSSTVADAGLRSSFFFTESESGDDDRETGGHRRAEQQSRHGDSSSSAIGDNGDVIEVHIRWNMVFIWQAPMMLLAYSVLAFLAGLTVYICTPLYNSGLDGKEVAIFYLASLGIGGFCFVWCCFWAYRFVDLENKP
ncbi:hypothetical protein F5Y02DRAFT_37456 [Annulohypoxylon stygium]|nr:hypothetical protein F5Y02DRAFT_37456 [Annulohypoxylon stygium]